MRLYMRPSRVVSEERVRWKMCWRSPLDRKAMSVADQASIAGKMQAS